MRILQVFVVDPPGDKMGITVMLCVRAYGVKQPAVAVFKGAAETGVLYRKIETVFVVPSNVYLKTSKNAWWSQKLDYQWLV